MVQEVRKVLQALASHVRRRSQEVQVVLGSLWHPRDQWVPEGLILQKVQYFLLDLSVQLVLVVLFLQLDLWVPVALFLPMDR